MTRKSSDDDVPSLARRYFEHQELQRQAIRRNDTPSGNRQHASLKAILDRLAAIDPQGRMALEAMMSHPMAYARLSGALHVYQWAPERAVPVLGALLIDDLGAETSAHERGDIRLSARNLLYLHFGVDDFDRNKLIEPLRAYGIELPQRQA